MLQLKQIISRDNAFDLIRGVTSGNIWAAGCVIYISPQFHKENSGIAKPQAQSLHSTSFPIHYF